MVRTEWHRNLEYRIGTPEDRAAIERLWESETEWGHISEVHWTKWYEENPYGKPIVVVATDGPDGSVVGQFVFLPSLVSVGGRIVKACRPFAPVIRGDARGYSRDFRNHPVMQMFHAGVAAMREQGVSLLYMIPNPKWLSLIERLNLFRIAVLPNYEHVLPFEQPFPADDEYSVGPLVQGPDQIDSLWTAAARRHDCIVVRDSSKWPWRISD